MVCLIAVNRVRRIAVLDDGQEIAVTNLFDEFGDETEDADVVAVFVAGPDAGGRWHVDRFDEYGGMRN